MQKDDHSSVRMWHNSHDFVVETAENECNSCANQMDGEEKRQSHVKSMDSFGGKFFHSPQTGIHTLVSLLKGNKEKPSEQFSEKVLDK